MPWKTIRQERRIESDSGWWHGGIILDTWSWESEVWAEICIKSKGHESSRVIPFETGERMSAKPWSGNDKKKKKGK